jgi:hypothetical protein
MKKRLLLLSVFLLALAASLNGVYADSLESVRVVKFWSDTDDLVVERTNGERLLLQHHYTCTSMSTEFPVQMVWENDRIKQLKVAANEICSVKNYGPYSSNITIVRRVPTLNSLVVSNTAEIEWKHGLYEINYGQGCTYLRNFEGDTAYVYTPEGELEGATLYLPKNRGQCTIKSAAFLKELESEVSTQDSPIKNIRVKAENNQAFLSWDAYPEGERWVTSITYSKYPFDPDDYSTSQLPGLKQTRHNTIRILQLDNDQKYHFYLSASDSKGQTTGWHSLEITPIQTATRYINHPDPETFEIGMEETEDSYILTWPDKSSQAKRYLIQLYVDGPREIFDIIPTDEPTYILQKKPEWEHSRFRFTVRTIPFVPTGVRYFDGIFWQND